jgi:hypothetical protein
LDVSQSETLNLTDDSTPKVPSFLCLKCENIFPKAILIQHYKTECLNAEGIGCKAAPYCRFVATRKVIIEHEETCGYIKIQCEACESTVIRRMIGNTHNCLENSLMRL